MGSNYVRNSPGQDLLLQCLRKSAVIAIEGFGTTIIELIAEDRNLLISYI